jgi:hypothetical protein
MEGLVLGRVGHYFDAGNGSCSTALVVNVFEGDSLVNVTAWNHDGTPFSRTSVSLEAKPAIEDTASSFHLNRDCPWGR